MPRYIEDLISRMSDESYRQGQVRIDNLYESEKTVSAAAHEEARLINNPTFSSELFSIVNASGDNTIKHHAYFILGFNAKNTQDLFATSFLLQKLLIEKERSILVVILDRLAELYKPATFDTSAIYKLTDHRNWQIRGAAFEALTNNENRVEDFLVNKLVTTDKKDDLRPLLTSLMYVGTKKSIPHVEKHLKNRQPFIKSYSINVLTVIMLREQYRMEEIQKKLRVSADFVQTHVDRLVALTRPG